MRVFVTMDELRENNACENAINDIQSNFGNEVELNDDPKLIDWINNHNDDIRWAIWDVRKRNGATVPHAWFCFCYICNTRDIDLSPINLINTLKEEIIKYCNKSKEAK